MQPKRGEIWEAERIIGNICNALGMWNAKLAEVWGLITQSPESYKGEEFSCL